ncbi:MAG: class C sortase [Varibaculum sp.]|nr:class C sortase [Varibaculum sp.]
MAEAPPTTHTYTPRSELRHQKPASLKRLLIPILLIGVGVLVLMYPVVATLHNNRAQNSIASKYDEKITTQTPALIEQELDSARAYNAGISGLPILDPWLERVAKDNDPYRRYSNELDLTTEMARVMVPKAHIDLPVYHGTSTEVLERGVGHLYGSSLPVGGRNTHTVLTGHSGLPSATLFDHLRDVRRGDQIFLRVLGKTLEYRVTEIQVVLPDEVDSLRPREGQDLVTLLTCTPYGVNSHRLLVTGERVVPPSTDGVPVMDATQWQWWMVLALLIAILALIALALWLHRQLHRRLQRQQDTPVQDVSKDTPDRRNP